MRKLSCSDCDASKKNTEDELKPKGSQMESWDWPEFVHDVQQLCTWSKAIGDGWQLIDDGTGMEGGVYMRKRQKCVVQIPPASQPAKETDYNVAADLRLSVPDEDASETVQTKVSHGNALLVEYDFHIVFHRSYRVPAICFNGHKPDGTLLMLDEVWRMFGTMPGHPLTGVITEMDHPVLFRPFHTLHPCRTAELLGTLAESRNRVLSFVSTMGPAVNLEMDVRYGRMCEEEE